MCKLNLGRDKCITMPLCSQMSRPTFQISSKLQLQQIELPMPIFLNLSMVFCKVLFQSFCLSALIFQYSHYRLADLRCRGLFSTKLHSENRTFILPNVFANHGNLTITNHLGSCFSSSFYKWLLLSLQIAEIQNPKGHSSDKRYWCLFSYCFSLPN